MKLGGPQATSYFTKPDLRHAGALIYGSDALRVDFRRRQLTQSIVGENAEEEMRLDRLSGADLRKESGALRDAIKAQGCFPGQRLVVIEDATDALAGVVETALADWQSGDAYVLICAGSLNARSKLRGAVEAAGNAVDHSQGEPLRMQACGRVRRRRSRGGECSH